MRKLVESTLVSLDCVIEAPERWAERLVGLATEPEPVLTVRQVGYRFAEDAA